METEFQSPDQIDVDAASATAPTGVEVQAHITQAVAALIAWVMACQTLTFYEFETQLVPQVLALGRLFIQLFLCPREAQVPDGSPSARAGVSAPRPDRAAGGDAVGQSALLAHLLLPAWGWVLPPGCGVRTDQRWLQHGAAQLRGAARHQGQLRPDGLALDLVSALVAGPGEPRGNGPGAGPAYRRVVCPGPGS